jgi:glycosyltransferase involved in cell wall biosynthesis
MELALPALPQARCAMVFQGGELETAVTERIRATPTLTGRVIPIGRVPHNALPSYYSAADVFLSASHHEGSGYALIESMACGVTPCVTDIPAFRALAGECGRRWRVGDARAAATALVDLAAGNQQQARALVRARFERALSWDVIGAQTVGAYRVLSERRLGWTAR